MPGSILDLIQSAMGHPDPAVAIAARLGQMPGQPGSPAGPQPLAGPAPSAGAPAGPGGGPGASGPSPAPGGPNGPPTGPPGGAPPPPQPQAYQTPPDLGSMFVQLMQRQQSNDMFNKGMGMLAAGFAQPRDRETMVNAMSGGGPDAGGIMGNLMKLQQYNLEQQNMAGYRQAVPGMLQKAGIDPSFGPAAMADPSIISKIVETQAGVGGNPAWQAQMHAEKALTNAGKPIPWTQGDPTSYSAWSAANQSEQLTRKKDLDADTANFPAAKDAYDSVLSDLDTLKNSKALPDILGGTNQYKTTGMVGLSSDTSNALALYNKIMGGQYAAGVQDFKGAGRITQQELKQDLPSQSTMPDRNTDVASFQASIDAYKAKLQAKRAQLFGSTGRLSDPDLSDSDYDKVSPIYKPGGPLFVGSQAARPAPTPAAAATSSSAAPASSSSSSASLKPLSADDLAQAKTNIVKYGRDAVIAHLKANNYDTSGL
jgi:hypothetical protein